MSYPPENTIAVAAASTSGGAATVKLPNTDTGALPADQVGTANPIGAAQRWRIRAVVASYSTIPAAPAELTITDGQFTWTIDVPGTLPLLPLDLQCAAGAEVDITLAAASGAVAHLNVAAVSEG